MKKRVYIVCLMIQLVLMGGNSFVKATETSFTLEVTDSEGSWETLTPMYLKCTETVNTAFAFVNATNINENNTLAYLQYFYWIFDYIEYEDPGDFETNEVDFLLEMDFGSTYVNVSYNWIIEDDGLEQTWQGDLVVFVNETQLVEVSDFGLADTRKIEIHLWRSKSNQIIFQWKLGEAGEQDRALGEVLPNWNLKSLNYTFMTITGREMSFTVAFDNLSYHCGSNEGISDPVTNENWGIFEPIRQVLLFVLKLFLGLIDLILPAEIEEVFDHYVERLGDYITPLMAIMIWLGANWLTILYVIHIFLIIRGLDRVAQGDFLGFIMPLLDFYVMIFNMVMKIIGFVVSIIQAIIGVLPF